MKVKEKPAIFMAVLAAALYALNSPLSKLLLNEISSSMMAGLLYLGAGVGMSVIKIIQKQIGAESKEQKLTKKDLPYTVGMVVLDIIAPICLMIGLTATTAANASLLNNFEIAATSIIAFFIYKEHISKRLWASISLVTLASIILSVEDASSFRFSYGSLFVLLACVCWGFENNCTRMISNKDPLEIVVIKGLGSGIGSLLIAIAAGEHLPQGRYIICAVLLGFVAYGLSIFFYIYAQRTLGAAKTSAYYALAPFIGSGFSMEIFREPPTVLFLISLLIMGAGACLAARD